MKKVLKRTGIIYDPDNPEHQGKPTELITANAQRKRVRNRALVTVLAGTGIIYDSMDPKHQGKPTERITVVAQRQRVRDQALVTVLVDTGIIYDSEDPDHQGKLTELITASAQRQRAKLVEVLVDTGVIYDSGDPDHQGKLTEQITAVAQWQRAKLVEVLVGTGIIYDSMDPKHEGKPTEQITAAAQRQRARRKRKKSQACNEGGGASKSSSNRRPLRMVVEAHCGRDNELALVDDAADPISKALDAYEREDATPIVVSGSDAESWGGLDAFTCDSLLSDNESDVASGPIPFGLGSPTGRVSVNVGGYSPCFFSPRQSAGSLGAGLMESDDETDMCDFDDNCSIGPRGR